MLERCLQPNSKQFHNKKNNSSSNRSSNGGITLQCKVCLLLFWKYFEFLEKRHCWLSHILSPNFVGTRIEIEQREKRVGVCGMWKLHIQRYTLCVGNSEPNITQDVLRCVTTRARLNFFRTQLEGNRKKVFPQRNAICFLSIGFLSPFWKEKCFFVAQN